MKRDLKWLCIGAFSMLLLGAAFYEGDYPLLTRIAFPTSQFAFATDTNVAIKDGVLLTNTTIRMESGGLFTRLEPLGSVMSMHTSGAGQVWQLNAAGQMIFATPGDNRVLYLDDDSVLQGVPNNGDFGVLTNNGSGIFGWFRNYITLITASNAFEFNPNQFTRTGTGGTNINISSGSLQTNNNFYGTTSHLGVQTNTGPINTAGVETNWNEVYMRALVTAGINANGFNFGHDTALSQTNVDGGARWASFAPNFGRRRCGFFINNFSASISIFGENSTTSGTLSYEAPQTNSWWTVVYTTAASLNADAGWNHNNTASWFPGGNICYDWVGRIGAIGTNQIRVWMGLTDTTLANMNGTDSPTTRNVAMVRYSQSASDANWQFVTCNASACTVTPSNTAVSTNRTSFRMVEDIENGRWVLYINGISAATNSATLPIAAMGSNFSIRSLNATAYAIRHSSGFISIGGGKGNPAGDFP